MVPISRVIQLDYESILKNCKDGNEDFLDTGKLKVGMVETS